MPLFALAQYVMLLISTQTTHCVVCVMKDNGWVMHRHLLCSSGGGSFEGCSGPLSVAEMWEAAVVTRCGNFNSQAYFSMALHHIWAFSSHHIKHIWVGLLTGKEQPSTGPLIALNHPNIHVFWHLWTGNVTENGCVNWSFQAMKLQRSCWQSADTLLVQIQNSTNVKEIPARTLRANRTCLCFTIFQSSFVQCTGSELLKRVEERLSQKRVGSKEPNVHVHLLKKIRLPHISLQTESERSSCFVCLCFCTSDKSNDAKATVHQSRTFFCFQIGQGKTSYRPAWFKPVQLETRCFFFLLISIFICLNLFMSPVRSVALGSRLVMPLHSADDKFSKKKLSR